MTNRIKVSIDGGVTWQEVDEVRVEAPDNEEDNCTMTMVMTHEGIIQDWWAKDEAGTNLHTGCTLWEDAKDIIGGDDD